MLKSVVTVCTLLQVLGMLDTLHKRHTRVMGEGKNNFVAVAVENQDRIV